MNKNNEANKIQRLREVIKKATDDKLNTVITKSLLGLDNNQVETVSFVFWLCYLTETKLEECIKEAVSQNKELLTEELVQLIRDNHKIDFNNVEYFGGKIKIYESTVGKNKFSKMLWKINNIRNDVSHTRTLTLKYKSQDLFLRET